MNGRVKDKLLSLREMALIHHKLFLSFIFLFQKIDGIGKLLSSQLFQSNAFETWDFFQLHAGPQCCIRLVGPGSLN